MPLYCSEKLFRYITIACLFLLLGHTSAWTSGNDIEVNGQYVWATTGKPVGPHTNWRYGSAPNEPDCQCIGINAIKEHSCSDCIGVFRWDEESCSEQKKFICELVTM